MSKLADALGALWNRLDAALADPSRLKGWTWDRQPVNKAIGERDLPALLSAATVATETAIGSTASQTTASLLFNVLTTRRQVRVGKSEQDDARVGHADAVAAFRKAVDMTEDGSAYDPLLGGLLAEPMQWTQGDAAASALAYATALTLSLKLRPEKRGER